MPADQSHTPAVPSTYSAKLQEALDLRRRVEAEEGARLHEEEVLAPFELCGVGEEDGPCLRSEGWHRGRVGLPVGAGGEDGVLLLLSELRS